jgi:hypothetical protein
MKKIYYGLLLSLLTIPFRLWSQCVDTDDAVQNNTRNLKTPFGSTVQAFDWRQEFFTLYLTNPSTNQTSTVTRYSPFFWRQGNLATKHLQDQPVNAKDFQPNDGWELVSKYLGEEKDPDKVPYLVLYNRYQGILRTFFFIPAGFDYSYNAARIDISFIRNTTFSPTVAFASNLLGYARIPTKGLDKFEKNIVSSTPIFVNSDGNFWLYADFPMAYDPCTCNYLTNIIIKPFLMNITKMEAIQNDVTQSSTNANSTTGNGFIPILDQSVKEVNDAVKKVTAISNTFKGGLGLIESLYPKHIFFDTKEKIDTSGSTGLATIINYVPTKKLTTFKMPASLKDAGGQIGLFLGLIELFSGSGTPTNTVAQKGLKFKISGIQTTEYPLTHTDIFVPGSDWPANAGNPLTKPVYDNTLGLFALVETPKIKFFNRITTAKGPVYEFINGKGQTVTSDEYNHVAWDFKLQDDIKYAINPASGYKPEPVDIKAALVFNVNAKCLNDKFSKGWSPFPPFCTFNGPNTSSLKIVRAKKADGTLSDTAVITTPLMPLSCIKDYVAHLAFLGNSELKAYGEASTAPFHDDVRLLIMANLEQVNDPTKQHLFTAQYKLFPEQSTASIPNTPISDIGLNPVFENLTLTADRTIQAWETVTFKGNVNTNGFKLTVIAGTEVNFENPSSFPATADIRIGLPTECNGTIPAQRPSQLYAFCAKAGTKKYDPVMPTIRERDEKDPIIAQKELKTMLNVVPNPFENRLTIHFALQEDSNVSISLTNAIGQVIKIQEFTQKGIGEYDEIMETNDVAPGVYYLTLQTKFGVETKKIVKQL